MQFFRTFVLFLAFCLAPAIFAQEAALPDVSKGEGFSPIVPPQPTQDPNKVEILEFFWYGCPHCYRFEPLLQEWAKSLPANVTLIKQPAIFSSNWAAGAYAYFVAEALGVTDKVHNALFDAFQDTGKPIESEEQLAELFAGLGVAKEDFHTAYNSFMVTTRIRQAESMPARYGITGVPAVVINGKYLTNGTLAKDYPGMIAVMNALIQQETANIKATSASTP